MGLSASSTTPEKKDSVSRKKPQEIAVRPTSLFSERELTPTRIFDQQLDPIQNIPRDSQGKVRGRAIN